MSVLYRQRPSEVAAWFAWEFGLIDRYLDKQPAAEERIEVALATLCAHFFNANFAGDQTAARSHADYLPFRDPWPQSVQQAEEPISYSDADLSVMKAFGLKG